VVEKSKESRVRVGVTLRVIQNREVFLKIRHLKCRFLGKWTISTQANHELILTQFFHSKIRIAKRVSWHTFRRTYMTLLHANGEDVKVVQELLRHSSAKVTMDIYAQAQMPAKRAAQQKVVEMIRPEKHRMECRTGA
jgi:integrase